MKLINKCNDCINLHNQKKKHIFICSNRKGKFYNIPFHHGKMRDACDQYKSKRKFIDPSKLENFKEITDFRNTKKNSTFWIIGSDPNLDFYPDNFFDDKLSIAISVSCIAFPSSTYFLITSNPVIDAIKRVCPDFLSKCILPLNCTVAKAKPYWEQLDPYWKDYGLDPIYLKSLATPQIAQTYIDKTKMVNQIFGNGLVEFTWLSSTGHLGIEVAAILGAKKIVLVGMSHKTTKYFFHAQRRGMWIFCLENRPGNRKIYPTNYRNGTIPELAIMKKDTIWLKKEFAKYGVEIIRHRFDEAKQDFVFEEIE